jgi:hypothetical protein
MWKVCVRNIRWPNLEDCGKCVSPKRPRFGQDTDRKKVKFHCYKTLLELFIDVVFLLSKYVVAHTWFTPVTARLFVFYFCFIL